VIIKKTIPKNSGINIEDVLSSKGRIKILKLLAMKEELNISAISNEVKLNHTIVKSHLKYLTEIGIVKEKKFGRILIYQYQNTNLLAKSLKRLFIIWEDQLKNDN